MRNALPVLGFWLRCAGFPCRAMLSLLWTDQGSVAVFFGLGHLLHSRNERFKYIFSYVSRIQYDLVCNPDLCFRKSDRARTLKMPNSFGCLS